MTLPHAFKKEGAHEKERQIALNMILENYPVEAIVKVTGLSKDELKKLKQEAETKH